MPEASGSIDEAEVARFAEMADEWWDPAGAFRPLHRLNPVRLAYLRDHLAAHFARDRLQRLAIAARDRHARTLARQRQRDRAADAAPAAGDDRHASAEACHDARNLTQTRAPYFARARRASMAASSSE